MIRTISSASPDDVLIASGVYRYYLGDEDTAIRESWQTHQSNDGMQVTRIERDAPRFKANILVEITTLAGTITRIDIRWKNGNDGVVGEAEATYLFSGHNLHIQRTCDGKAFKADYALDSHTLISPLMRVWMGNVLTKLTIHPYGTTVLIPNIKEPHNPDVLLDAHFEHRSAKLLAAETLTISDNTYQANCYQYIGEQYTENARFWLDDHAVLLRYTFKQDDSMAWNIELRDYVRT